MINMMLWSVFTTLVYFCFKKVVQLLKITAFNPILLAIISLIILLLISNTPYGVYKEATAWITYLLGPVVVMLAVPLYKNRQSLMKNLLPITSGVVTSFFVSLLSVVVLSRVFKLPNEMLLSLLPKSITTPMAIEVTVMLNGVEGLTIVFVILTGVIGASLAPLTLKLFKVNDPLAKGIGIGTSSHGIGTSKAVELGEAVAAASGLAMGLSGVTTVLLYSVISNFIIV